MEVQKAIKQSQIEGEIIRLLKKQDEKVIEMIYENYSSLLFNIIFRIVRHEEIAQDVFQEALIKIWKKGDLYHPDKGSIYTWIVSVCKHAAIDKTRSKDFKHFQRTQEGEPIEQMNNRTDAASTPREEMEHLREALQNLPEKQRLLIDMSFFQGYTHEEIAKKLDIPLGTIKTRIRSAIKKLRKVL